MPETIDEDEPMTAEEAAASQAAYDLAADIAHEMTKDIPEKVIAAGGDPIDAAYALWRTFTRILLENGWTACDLSADAHEMAEDEGIECVDAEDDPEIDAEAHSVH